LKHKYVVTKNLVHFPSCNTFKSENNEEFPSEFAVNLIKCLRDQFKSRLQDFEEASSNIRIFQNPFAAAVEDLPPDLQMEVIEPQSNDIYKDSFQDKDIRNFYATLPEETFPNLRDLACAMISLFSSTYLCEQTFSRMKFTKSKYRTNLTNKHLEASLLIGTTKFEPEYVNILSNKQCQTSH
jgi:hypothetical protein